MYHLPEPDRRSAPDQRLRWRFSYVADLPERTGGWGHDYDRVQDWLIRRFGGLQGGRWYLLGLRAYFIRQDDCEAFCEAWKATQK